MAVILSFFMELKAGIWNIRGMSSSIKQDEVVNIIREERLNVCVILETHLNSKQLNKVCDRVFGNWEWFSNMRYSEKGCRIIVSWNPSHINIISLKHLSKLFFVF